MALPQVNSASYPTPKEVLAILLASVRYAYTKRGLEANAKPGSDLWNRCWVNAQRISIAIANNQIALADFNPLAATGDALATLAGIYGVEKRGAASAAGFVTVTVTGSATIPAEFECVAPNGKTYRTVGSTLVTTSGSIEVVATETGADTDQATGTLMQWSDSAIGNLNPVCTVGSGDPIAGDISGGNDGDDDEGLRARLLDRLAAPATGGNWSDVKRVAENSTSSVAAAFPYPAVRGPASYDIAVTSTGGDRTLSTSILSIVASALAGYMPEHTDANVTTVTPEYVDVVLETVLPLPTNAGGAGGGWKDATPWPDSTNAGDGRPVRVTAVSGNTLTVNATTPNTPATGHRFALWDTTARTMKRFTVKSVSGPSGAYVITIDTAVSGALAATDVNGYVSADCQNLETYAEQWVEQMNGLGPGEKTSNVDILPRGARHPGPDVSDSPRLSNVLLGRVSRENVEMLDLSYAARLADNSGVTLTSPTVAATTADPPNILVLKRFAIRKA